MLDEKTQPDQKEMVKAFEVVIDNDIDTFGETVLVLALDITEAQVIAHEAVEKLKEMFERPGLRVKGVNEHSFVVAPEYGFTVDTWLARIKQAVDEDD